MRLLIDLGNTRVKWAWQAAESGGYHSNLESAQSAAHDGGQCAALLESMDGLQIEQIWLSSVAGAAAEQLCLSIATICPLPIGRARSPALFDGIRNAYHEPERLGVDRFLALLGARRRYPHAPLVVVDAGTALTIDVLSTDGLHLGGSIAPGLQLMRHSLGRGTATLGTADRPPSVGPQDLGTDTPSSIECGLLSAAAGAIAWRLQQQLPDARLLLTGGDASALAAAFPHAEQLPQLVLEGLSRYADCSAAENAGAFG